jgi:hypothetical protein
MPAPAVLDLFGDSIAVDVGAGRYRVEFGTLGVLGVHVLLRAKGRWRRVWDGSGRHAFRVCEPGPKTRAAITAATRIRDARAP